MGLVSELGSHRDPRQGQAGLLLWPFCMDRPRVASQNDDPEMIGLALLYPARERNCCVPGHRGYPRLTYMFISHDLRVVAVLASHLIVMRQGKVEEEGPASDTRRNNSL